MYLGVLTDDGDVLLGGRAADYDMNVYEAGIIQKTVPRILKQDAVQIEFEGSFRQGRRKPVPLKCVIILPADQADWLAHSMDCQLKGKVVASDAQCEGDEITTEGFAG